MKTGTIRRAEAIRVIHDVLVSEGLSPASWAIREGQLEMLIGDRKHVVKISAGQTFYRLEQMRESVRRAIGEAKAAKANRNQIDLESAIAACGAPP